MALLVRRTSTRLFRIRRNWTHTHPDHEGSTAGTFSRIELGCRYATLTRACIAAYAAYDAYFGTYTLDAERQVVTLHAEGSLQPDYTNTEQPRPFRLEGDRLVIGDEKTYRCVLQRVR